MNETKILMIGDREVGKSCVAQLLIKNGRPSGKKVRSEVEFNEEIEISRWEVDHDGKLIILNIWDFGWEQYEYSTYKFFLTKRSLYLLVLDARKGDQITNVEYWLTQIDRFRGNSPIIVVINQIDQLLGQRALNLDREDLSKKYNIKDFIETSCTTPSGIEELKAAIIREVEEMHQVPDRWPPEWLAIRNRLKNMQADYIPFEKYLEICGEENLNDETRCRSLLDRLHDSGVVIVFPGDTQVLNPRWVTRGVYGLLTSTSLLKEQGQFDLKDVGKYLNSLPNATSRYPSHTHRRLIDVMRHFELCFEFTDRAGHYLIPRHLHDNEVDVPWNDAAGLEFQYHYEALPDAMISRFLVRMGQYTAKQYYWKNGVYLRTNENWAKVKADQVDRTICISITGKEQTRRAFLAIIRFAFDEINSNFPIKVKQMIPVPGFPEVFISYEELLVLEEMGEQEILIPKLLRRFAVRDLLDGVEELRTRQARRASDLNERRAPEQMPEETKANPDQRGAVQKNNPWLSGSFNLFSFVVIIATIVVALVVLNKFGISWTTVAVIPVVLIGGLLALGIIGANQLRNDERLTDQSYVKLMVESYRRLPLLRAKGQSRDMKK